MIKRIVLVTLVVFTLFNCSSDDDASSFDLSLLYGKWFRVGLCQQYNSLQLNQDGTYESFFSGSADCNDSAVDVYKYTGTYVVNGDFYTANRLTSELIIDGTDISTNDFEQIDAVTEIIELTETTFKLRTYVERENGVIETIETSEYER
ncbi:hypothetical protein [Winogradskyella jejuensis]|uniref:Lipocalin-like domain-containing protein n=1 Tax=Winogradskyella jejuensis TaxID=1089305 RepID=A0A1M5K7R7_9FLAO|nr:hypothetical protein [Winogradskyella jejuensis]SHG48844.1 hypothetical protein SAMN05444148_0253 [Winogradskyella jejuensis]